MRDALDILVSPLCPACRRPAAHGEPLCGACDAELRAARPLWVRPPSGVDAAWAACPHEGTARDLVSALKFRRLLAAADAAAIHLARAAPEGLMAGAAIVPVPSAPVATRLRGFDPASEIARALAPRTGASVCRVLRRRGARGQRGRSRRDRLASPPRVQVIGRAPTEALLLDDVVTTGATVAACAKALRQAGAARVAAVSLTHET